MDGVAVQRLFDLGLWLALWGVAELLLSVVLRQWLAQGRVGFRSAVVLVIACLLLALLWTGRELGAPGVFFCGLAFGVVREYRWSRRVAAPES